MSEHAGPTADEVLIIDVRDALGGPEACAHSYTTFEEARAIMAGMVALGLARRPIAHGMRVLRTVHPELGEMSFVDFVDWHSYQADMDRLARKGVTR